MLDLKVNVIIGEFLMSGTMKATIHLGLDHNANLFTYKNTDFEELETLFGVTQKLILEQKHDSKQLSTIEWHVTPWTRSTLQHDRVIKLSEAKYMFIQIPCFVWERCIHSHWSWSSGKIILNISRTPMKTKN